MRGSGKPTPFKNPRIEVSTDAVAHGAKKEWQDVDPRWIEVGDIIQGKGLVVAIGDVYKLSDPAQYRFEFEMKNGTTEIIYAHSFFLATAVTEELTPHVRVFTRVRG